MLNKEMLFGISGKQTYTCTLTNKTSEVLTVTSFYDPWGYPYNIETNPSQAVLNPGDTVVFEILNMDGRIANQNDKNPNTYYQFIIRFFPYIVMNADMYGDGCTVIVSGGGLEVQWPKVEGAKSMGVTVTRISLDDDS